MEIREGTPVFIDDDDGNSRRGIAASEVYAGPLRGRSRKRASHVWVLTQDDDAVMSWPAERVRIDDTPIPGGSKRPYMKLKKAAKLFSASYDMLYWGARSGVMPSIRPSHAYLVTARDVQIFLNYKHLERRRREGR